MRTRGKRVAAFAAATALAGTVGIAYAAIPGPDGAIHGCVKTVSGQVRVIDPSAGGSCAASEQSLNWNLTGAQGSPGLPGPAGAQGSAGAAGSSGLERIVKQFSTDGNGDGDGQASCSSGKRVLMGGYELDSSGPLRAVMSAPTTGGTGWDVQVTGATGSFVVSAICANATTPQS